MWKVFLFTKIVRLIFICEFDSVPFHEVSERKLLFLPACRIKKFSFAKCTGNAFVRGTFSKGFECIIICLVLAHVSLELKAKCFQTQIRSYASLMKNVKFVDFKSQLNM